MLFTANISIQGQILSGFMTKMKKQGHCHLLGQSPLCLGSTCSTRTCLSTFPVSGIFRLAMLSLWESEGPCKTLCFNLLKVTKAANTKEQL